MIVADNPSYAVVTQVYISNDGTAGIAGNSGETESYILDSGNVIACK